VKQKTRISRKKEEELFTINVTLTRRTNHAKVVKQSHLDHQNYPSKVMVSTIQIELLFLIDQALYNLIDLIKFCVKNN
jgi:hypothetical protein